MTSSGGTADQILSLPKGGGAVQGLGETFQPDFHTGTGSYAIPLDLPNGPNDIAPKLTLLYGTAAGNGPFGMGFGLNLLTIGRSTDRRVPTYTEDDPLVLHGGGELVDAGGGRLRLRNETNAWRFHRDGDGFRITDTEGKIYRLGITAQARRFAAEGGTPKVLDWLLEEIADPLGNTVSYRYRRDGEQIYLERVAYGPYAVTFSYVPRPDPLVDGRAGFVITTGLRCTAVELALTGAAQPLLRRWELTYGQSLPGGHSLLRQVKLTGFDESGAQASLPTLTLGYSGFSPRRLERFRGESPEAMPGGGVGGRRELVDWDGDGLPDLIEIGAGRGRVWPNRGECTWGRPQSLGPLPAPVALDEPGIAFADMEGNGTADLLMLDRGLTGFYPHRPRGGFDRPVFWRQAPAARLTDPNARLVDLDADGIIDLLVTDDRFFELHFRAGDDGWRPRPVTVARPEAPPVSFQDPRIHLADMNGDGLQDLVRVDGAGVTYWPYLGNAAWAAPVDMENPPALPPRFDPDRLFLSDIDGDGCADLVYVDAERVLYWLNGGSTRLSDPVEVAYTPPAQTDEIRLADMRGSGTAGVLWTFAGPARRSTDFFYLDFMGGTKPYLLNRIDNGMGAVTEIAYGTSTGEAARDRRVGHAWHTFLPFAVPVVTEITMTDGPTGRRSESRFRYRDGHFDGVGREFCGFREVEIEEIGDAAAPTMQTRNRYHLGLDPADPARRLTEAERIRLRTLRGKLLRAEVFGLDGAPEQDLPYTRTESEWRVDVVQTIGTVEILAPRQVATTTTAFERRPAPFRVTTDRNLLFDADGNVTDREQVADDPRDPSLRRSLRTITTYAHDPTGRFRGKAARTTQRDGAGTPLSTTITYYDGLPEGQIGAQGLLTKLECLVLTDAMVAAVYGAAPPDFAALGYHRRPGEDGWWIDQVAYTRTDDAGGLRGTVANALGRTTQLSFDAQKLHPVRIVDPLGNVSGAVFDPRANKLRTLTDANGATIANRYDPLGRLRLAIEPGATEALPTTRHDYQTATLPVAVTTAARAVNGRAATLNGRVFYDGLGQTLEERRSTGSGEIVERAQLYGSRGMVRAQFLPRAAAGPGYALPTDDLPHQSFRYDAIGRLVEMINPDGSSRRQVYEPGVALLFDEEDTRTGPGANHADTPTRLAYDPTGRIMEVALDDGVTLLRTRYEYDVKGNLVAVTEADGRRSRFAFDLLGHHLRTESPASGVTTFVFDANGNPVRREDARGEVVDYLHDELDRLRRVSFPATGEVASEFTYHDTGRPPPPGASAFTKGRVVRVAHQGGTEVYRYDALGRVTRKTVTGPGLPGAGARFDFTYRADGQRASVTYPAHAPGAPRVRVGYEYDARGLLRRIPGFVREIAYNAAGQRTRVRYDNGVVTAYGYDQLTMRVSDLVTRNGAGAVLQQFGHAFDLAGNLTAVASPDPRTTMTYGYDDLYRLTDAARGSGETWTYAYDGVGNISTKSDVGAFSYDVGGRLTAAGPDAFAYSAAGQAVTGPWGQTTYDAHGRLTTIVAGAEQTSCAYDHDGRRVRLRVTGAAPHDILTPDDLLSIEDGVFLAAIYDGTARVAQLRLDTGAVAFLHGDHLGSTTLVTGPTGNVVQRVFYDPFGAVLENEVVPGGDGTRYLYTGAELDARSGLTYLHARYYHPKYGRFLTPDTLVPDLHQPQAWNRYAYVQNNPLRYVDPTGHFFEEIGDWFEDNWKYVVAAVAIVAIVVLTIVTFGAAGIIAVGIAMAIGGAIGGISAHAAGGDVLLGILVGMAVGGAAAFAGLGIGAGMAAVFGKGTLAATLLTGTLSGAVTGAAMGFTAGYAGGMGSADTIWDRMWKGALVGAITGLVLGGLSYWFQKSPFGPRLFSSTDEVKKGFAESAQGAAKSAGQAGSPAGAAGTLAMAPFSGSQNTGAYFLSPLLGGGSVLGGSVAAWQIAGIGLTSAISGAFVLDWADDLWKWVAGSGFAKFEKSGSM